MVKVNRKRLAQAALERKAQRAKERLRAERKEERERKKAERAARRAAVADAGDPAIDAPGETVTEEARGAGRPEGATTRPATMSPRDVEPGRIPRKDPQDYADLRQAIHNTHKRQEELCALYRDKHPQSGARAVDPFEAGAREQIPAEYIAPLLDMVIGISCMLCKPLPQHVPSEEAKTKCCEAWSRASVYLPAPSPAAVAIGGASLATVALIGPMAVARFKGEHDQGQEATVLPFGPAVAAVNSDTATDTSGDPAAGPGLT